MNNIFRIVRPWICIFLRNWLGILVIIIESTVGNLFLRMVIDLDIFIYCNWSDYMYFISQIGTIFQTSSLISCSQLQVRKWLNLVYNPKCNRDNWRKGRKRRLSDGRQREKEKLNGLRRIVSGFVIMRTWLVVRKVDWKNKIVPDHRWHSPVKAKSQEKQPF